MGYTFTSFQDFKRRYPIRPNDKESLLGSGSYGRVIKVEDQLETEWVAIKISEFKGNDAKSLRAEVELAKRLPRQQNIARYDACYRLETDTSVSDFAIMKYYPDGNLASLLQHEKLTSAQHYDIAKGILLGLQHLHRNRIVHRDFKPANILISRDNKGHFVPKIADFGLSKLVSDDELDSSDFDLSDGRGTPSYKAPEQIEGSRVSFNLDLWAFGVILYEMLTGEKPFRADARNVSEQSIRREIEKKIITVDLPNRLYQIAQPYRAMIERCLVHDIHERVRKETELLDLLDNIPQLLADAQRQIDTSAYEQAISLYEQVLEKREKHAEAEHGIEICREAIERREIEKLLQNANRYVTLGDFQRAKDNYEQILRRDPTNVAAKQGQENCLERLQPKLVDLGGKTDIYAEGTDVYIPAVEKSADVIKGAGCASDTLVETDEKMQAATSAIVPSESIYLSKQLKVVAIVAVLIAGVWYVWPSQTNDKNTPETVPASLASSVDGNTISKAIEKESAAAVAPQEKAILTKRIDVAMIKAREAFHQKNYKRVLELTNSALQLDPTRQDVVALRNTATKASSQSDNVSESTVATSQPVSTPLSKPTEAEPVKSNSVNVSQQVQENYDQLVDEGMKAITGSNNKAKAIDKFNAARLLAKEHDLSTTKGDAAFNYSLNKGMSYFEREEFEGAKAWFLVAQSLKDTDEVRRKIKQCTNQ